MKNNFHILVYLTKKILLTLRVFYKLKYIFTGFTSIRIEFILKAVEI